MEVSNTGARIRAARKELAMSQDDLSRRLGVHRATVGRWENNPTFVPSLDHLLALSRELDVGVAWLVGRDEQQPSQSSRPNTRRELEERLMSVSKHVPVSVLVNVVTLLESATVYLDA
ncbi:transcriptional regulator with XRE-family HTH domain [Xanthomonas arboricola]|uniref:helix-turn-helix domain-containing protein n=1 Tax=Xanthomonas euroxanthea TaxID=2259622 RepID=UPI00161A65B2|nr:helix-turn-helix transcriptional regulator [Xanthomonas euroxanthea]MBB3815197.1 transcriptional regulator with XRE-family HTH domain [Xanthomonas euroxanthea]